MRSSALETTWYGNGIFCFELWINWVPCLLLMCPLLLGAQPKGVAEGRAALLPYVSMDDVDISVPIVGSKRDIFLYYRGGCASGHGGEVVGICFHSAHASYSRTLYHANPDMPPAEYLFGFSSGKLLRRHVVKDIQQIVPDKPPGPVQASCRQYWLHCCLHLSLLLLPQVFYLQCIPAAVCATNAAIIPTQVHCTAAGEHCAMPHDLQMEMLRDSLFCLVIPGDTPSSRRLAETMLAGCLPVFFGPPYHTMPLADALDYPSFSVGFGLCNHNLLLVHQTVSFSYHLVNPYCPHYYMYCGRCFSR